MRRTVAAGGGTSPCHGSLGCGACRGSVAHEEKKKKKKRQTVAAGAGASPCEGGG